jgi:outer membrane protein assembly factor BamD
MGFCAALLLGTLPAWSQTPSPFYEGGEEGGSLSELFKRKVKAPEAEEDLYQEALAQFEGKPTWLAKRFPEPAEKAKGSKYSRWWYYRTNYQGSIELFQKLIYEYPFTKHLADADFYIAEAYFKNKDYDIAVPAYQNFLIRHPKNARAEYARYQLGICHFERRKKNPLKDQSETEAALQAFRLVVIMYPESSYKGAAEDYLKKCEEALATKETKLGDFYYSRKEYFSGSLRYHRAWTEYPNASKSDYALWREAACYQKMGRAEDVARAYRELVGSYPKSQYASPAQEYLKSRNEEAKPSESQ